MQKEIKGIEQVKAGLKAEQMKRRRLIDIFCEHEPNPCGNGEPVLPFVLEAITQRSIMGKEKYGTLLKTNNGRDALVDLFQELLDAVMYCAQLVMEAQDGKDDKR